MLPDWLSGLLSLLGWVLLGTMFLLLAVAGGWLFGSWARKDDQRERRHGPKERRKGPFGGWWRR